MMLFLGIVLHFVFMFFAIVLSKMAENEDVIDDAELPIIVSIFCPIGVLVVVGALWVADMV